MRLPFLLPYVAAALMLTALHGTTGAKERRKRPKALAVNTPAPDFELPSIGKDGASGKKVKLSSVYPDKPVVLYFSSFT